MKIRDQRVGAAKRSWRVDEQRRFAKVSRVICHWPSVSRQEIFNCPNRRRTNCDAPTVEGRKQRALRWGRNLVKFLMNRVRLDRVGRDWFEGAEPDVQRDVRGPNTAVVQSR